MKSSLVLISLVIDPSELIFFLYVIAELLGKGGHAEVYKGCLPDGQVVAVKKITKKAKKDENRVGEFLSELGIIAHINHPNAAKLIGFSIENGLYLVLQFAPNGSLATLLHGANRFKLSTRSVIRRQNYK